MNRENALIDEDAGPDTLEQFVFGDETSERYERRRNTTDASLIDEQYPAG